MKNGDLLIYTIANLIEKRFNEVYPLYSTELSIEKSRTKKYSISIIQYELIIGKVYIYFQRNYGPNILANTAIESNLSFFEHNDKFMRIEKKKAILRKPVEEFINDSDGFIDELITKTGDLIRNEDFFTMIQLHGDSASDFMMKISSDLALNAFLKGQEEVQKLREQVKRVIAYVESRAKTGRNIVIAIFLHLILIHLTTKLKKRQELIDKLKKSYLVTLKFFPSVFQDPMPIFLSGKSRYFKSRDINKGAFIDIYRNMIID